MGIEMRADALVKANPEKVRVSLFTSLNFKEAVVRKGVETLVGSMGRRFKVLGITGSAFPAAPGFP